MNSQHTASGDRSPGLSANAREVLSFLHQRGASFFADIVRTTRKLKSEVEMALWELVAAGMITADDFDNLRALIDPRRRAGRGIGRVARPRHSGGRWSLLYAGEAPDRAVALESTCWMLLRRYGVVFREVLERESILPKWRELLITFRRLEDRGEIRGGRFVGGFLGEQFALPAAVESLRAMRKQEASGESVSHFRGRPAEPRRYSRSRRSHRRQFREDRHHSRRGRDGRRRRKPQPRRPRRRAISWSKIFSALSALVCSGSGFSA